MRWIENPIFQGNRSLTFYVLHIWVHLVPLIKAFWIFIWKLSFSAHFLVIFFAICKVCFKEREERELCFGLSKTCLLSVLFCRRLFIANFLLWWKLCCLNCLKNNDFWDLFLVAGACFDSVFFLAFVLLDLLKRFSMKMVFCVEQCYCVLKCLSDFFSKDKFFSLSKFVLESFLNFFPSILPCCSMKIFVRWMNL